MLNYLTGEGFGGNVSSGVESSRIACDWLVVNLYVILTMYLYYRRVKLGCLNSLEKFSYTEGKIRNEINLSHMTYFKVEDLMFVCFP